MHDWLPVFVDAMADKQLQSRFKTFRANELCRENIELNICFDLNLYSLTIQVHETRFLCARSLCCICFCSTPQSALHIQDCVKRGG